MAFSSSPPAPASGPDEKIAAAGFWPEIDINHFRDTMRVAGTSLTTARIRKALADAMVSAANDLAAWAITMIAAGHNSLSDVPPHPVLPMVDGLKREVHLWRSAVYAWATADLSESHRDISATMESANRLIDIELTADDHRRNAVAAIRDIRGERRVMSDLI